MLLMGLDGFGLVFGVFDLRLLAYVPWFLLPFPSLPLCSYEKRLTKAYTEMLEKQDRDRTEALRKVERRQKALGGIGMAAANSMADKAKADADRADMWRIRYEAEADERVSKVLLQAYKQARFARFASQGEYFSMKPDDTK